MQLENAITSALEFETRIRDMYIEAAARVNDADGEKIFRALADDEQPASATENEGLQHWAAVDEVVAVPPRHPRRHRQQQTGFDQIERNEQARQKGDDGTPAPFMTPASYQRGMAA